MPTPTQDQILPGPPRQKRRPIWLIAGILIVALGALTAWYAVGLSHDIQAIGVFKDVPRGQTIAATDLVIVDAAADPRIPIVPAEDLSQIVGKYAAIDLHAGSLLPPGAAVDQLSLSSGLSVVGIALPVGRLPAQPLQTGDKVRVIQTPRDQDDLPTTPPDTISATVSITRPSTDGAITEVDLTLPTGQAARLAQMAATGRICVVLDSKE